MKSGSSCDRGSSQMATRSAVTWSMALPHDNASDPEPVSGFEPMTVRLQGAIQRSRNVGGRGRTCHLAASTVAHGSPTSVTVCLRWLPVWLPAPGNPTVIGLHKYGCADRSPSTRLLQLSRTRTSGPGSGLPHVRRGTYDRATACLLFTPAPLTIGPMSPGVLCSTCGRQVARDGQGWSGCCPLGT